MNTPQTIIDAHAIIGREAHLSMDTGELLRRMDAAEIETALARPMGAALAVHNRAGNDDLLQAGPRIRALVSANPWYGADAVDELARCRDLGAVGLCLHPSLQGFMPTSQIVLPLVGKADAWGWPVMVHTGSYIQSDAIGLGWLAEQFPETAFIAGFGGFTDMWFDLPGLFRRHRNLYLDCSMMWSDAIGEIVRLAGADRVLFGGGEPRNRYAAAIDAITLLELPADDQHFVFCGNAKRLFHLS